MAAARSSWTEALDDLEERLQAAELGDLDRLGGWVAPGALGPASPSEAARAERVLARQRSLASALVERRTRVRTTQLALRRPEFRVPAAAPVYLDRNA